MMAPMGASTAPGVGYQSSARRWRIRLLFATIEGRLSIDGPVAQLGARLNGIQEVTGSIPVRSTTLRSPAPVSELRVASHPSLSISGERCTLSELTSVAAKG